MQFYFTCWIENVICEKNPHSFIILFKWYSYYVNNMMALWPFVIYFSSSRAYTYYWNSKSSWFKDKSETFLSNSSTDRFLQQKVRSSHFGFWYISGIDISVCPFLLSLMASYMIVYSFPLKIHLKLDLFLLLILPRQA